MLAQTYEQYKPLLFGLAYRMLGSAADAEDVVQDVFARYLQLEPEAVRNEKAYLTRMTANRCINLLKSSRRQRETYTGPWLPEPLADAGADPAERRDNIAYAYIVLLQRLSPLERAIFILKQSLGFEYREIADMLDKSEISCRQTFSRANRKMRDGAIGELQGEEPAEAKERFVDAFLRASDTGNFKPLLAFLMDEVTLVSDSGGKARAALKPIYGLDRVMAFFEGLATKGRLGGFVRARLNGEPGLVRRQEGRVTFALCAEWDPDGSRIRTLYAIVNPDKLAGFS